MLRIFFVFLITAVTLLILPTDFVFAQRVITLFEDFSYLNTSGIQAKSSSERTYIDLNFEVLRQKNLIAGDILEFSFNGEPIQLEVSRAEQYTPGTYSVIARNPVSNEMIVFTVTDTERIMGKIHLRGHDTYNMDFDQEQKAVYLQMFSSEEHDFLMCGLDELTDIPVFEVVNSTDVEKSSLISVDAPHSSAIASNQDDEITIDLLSYIHNQRLNGAFYPLLEVYRM